MLYIQYLNVVTGRDLINHALKQSGDARFDDLRYIVSDWSQVEKTEVSTLDVKELIACLIPMSKICPDVRNASIVKRNNTGVGLAAWYRHLGDTISWKIDIFHSPEEACDHYGLDITQIMQDAQLPDASADCGDAPKDTPPAMSQAPSDQT